MNTKPKLSLCIIVKPTKEEAKLLDRALSYVSKYVDEICITQAGFKKSPEVSRVVKKYGARENFFKWIYDFSAARNFNFKMATGDYIFWIDTDDVVRGAEYLPKVVKKMDEDKLDTVVMNYLYDFAKEYDFKVCTVKHVKTRIVKKGSSRWIGEIHEDFEPLRELKPIFCDEIEILHISDEERAKESSKRNTEIAKKFLEKHPEDPWGQWLVANALTAEKKEEDAIKYYLDFIEGSNSHESIYMAFLRLGDARKRIPDYLQALALRPDYPDAYLRIGEQYYNQGEWDLARRFILVGLQIRTPKREVLVYNPRDYDFNPLMTLAKVYFELKEFKNAVRVLERCRKIIPKHPRVLESLALIDGMNAIEKEADKAIEKAKKIKDKKKLKKFLEGLSPKLQSHPKISIYRNMHFVKTTSTGKDIAYYCPYTDTNWFPGAEKIGGSEEAVINLAKQWKKQGYNVTVFNSCGYEEKVYDGVTYKPYWMYNPRDVYDTLIFWRHPKNVDFDHASKRILIDVHDVLPEGEFTPDRIEKIHKVMFKTKAHRDLFPNIPDEKCSIVPNGFDPEPFKQEIERNPYLILNTSSPDRHLDTTIDVFQELVRRQPDKPWKLAWYYGWHNYTRWNKDNKILMDYYKEQSARFEALKKKGLAEGGHMIPQDEIAKKYLEAGTFLYPTQFFEIHCISAVKAQAAGCKIVTSDFAALNETVRFGTKIHTPGDRWKTESTFGDRENVDKYVDAIIAGMKVDPTQQQWANETYNWDKISKEWTLNFPKKD